MESTLVNYKRAWCCIKCGVLQRGIGCPIWNIISGIWLSPVDLVRYQYMDSQYPHPFDAAVDCLESSVAIDCQSRHHCFPTTSSTYNRQWSDSQVRISIKSMDWAMSRGARDEHDTVILE